MRVLIVDDEPLARTALTNALLKRPDVEAFDTASDAVDALDKIGNDSYDVLLLDINMPEVSGIQLVDRIRAGARQTPAIVFVTAHQEHAIAAFEKHAVDYVLKPFTAERLGKALDAASRRSMGERAVELVEILPHLQRLSQRHPCRIAIKAKGRILFIDPGDVVAVQAEGNYVLLLRQAGSYLLRESISAIAEKLKPYGFIRIHRSVLVNSAFVEEIRPYVTGEYGLRVKGGKEYTVTRTYKKNLKSLADLWIAPESLAEQT
jgi:two-component system LytT family response regulator